MSRNNTAYCKVCQDAGKPESIYRSHFTRETRDPNSRVTCPTLLALECRYCFKKGHTVKYCQKLKQRDEPPKAYTTSKPPPQKPAFESKSSNPYMCLDSDSDSEPEDNTVSITPIDLFPQLCVPAKSQRPENSYASALLRPESKPKSNPEPKANTTPKLAPWISTPSTTSSSILVPPLPPSFIRKTGRSWADDTDSEDDEPTYITIPKDSNVVAQVADDDW